MPGYGSEAHSETVTGGPPGVSVTVLVTVRLLVAPPLGSVVW